MVSSPRGALLAGIDIGTTSVKAGIYDAQGTSVYEARTPTPTTAAQLISETLSLLADCIHQTDAAPAAVGVTSMAETGTFLDVTGQSTGPLISWQAPTRKAAIDTAVRLLGRRAYFTRTGLHISGKIPLLHWLDGIPPDARTWVSTADLITAALSGELITEPSLAGRTGAFNLAEGAWDADLLALAGLSPGRMPPARTADDQAAAACRSTATQIGLSVGTPVRVAGHDHLVAAWAAGVRGAGDCADSMGTAEAIVTVTATPVDTDAALAQGASISRHVSGDLRAVVSGAPAAGALVDWCLRLVGREPDASGYAWFCAQVARAEQAPTGIVVEPYLRGRAAPAPDPRRALRIHGVTSDHARADLMRAVIEGAAMHAQWMRDRQAAAARPGPGPMPILGGPTAVQAWMQIKAQLSPTPVAVTATRNAACAGAALRAGEAAGVTGPATRLPQRSVDCDERTIHAWRQTYHDRFLPAVTNPDTTPAPQGCPLP